MAKLDIAPPSPRLNRFVIAAALVAFLTATDLLIKWAMTDIVMNPPQVIPVLPFFNIVLVFNRGVSFGLLGDLGSWGPAFLSLVTFVIVAVLLVWLWRAKRTSEIAALILILGGAIGNLIDRVQDGAVTDYLDFYASQYHWPSFNAADTFIVVGFALLLISSQGIDQTKREES